MRGGFWGPATAVSLLILANGLSARQPLMAFEHRQAQKHRITDFLAFGRFLPYTFIVPSSTAVFEPSKRKAKISLAFRISRDGHGILLATAAKLGLSQTGTIELALRDLADRRGVKLKKAINIEGANRAGL